MPSVTDDGNGNYSISLYTDEPATSAEINTALAQLDAAFANQFNNTEDRVRFFALLAQRMAANGFTRQRTIDAVNYVIDNCRTYKQINIADVIQFDKTAECLTYAQMCRRAHEGENVFETYQRFETPNGKAFYRPRN